MGPRDSGDGHSVKCLVTPLVSGAHGLTVLKTDGKFHSLYKLFYSLNV